MELLKAGASWNGSGWNTGRASKALHDLVGVPLVTSDFSEYRNAFFYALALYWGVEVPQLELGDRAAEAAFALVRCFQTGNTAFAPPAPSVAAPEARQEDKGPDGPEDVVMEWDEPEFTLPKELAALWSGVAAGTRRLNLAQLLDSVPRFVELPVRPAENNFRGQGRASWNRQLRSYQQTLLHGLRMWSAVYMCEDQDEATTRFKMAWQLTAELYQKIQADRKEASIPGCVGSQAPQLFGKDDLAQVQMNQKVNMAGKPGWKGSAIGKGRFRGFNRCGVFLQTILSSTLAHRFPFRGKSFGFRGGYQGQGGQGLGSHSHGGKGGRGKGMSCLGAMAAIITPSPQVDVKDVVVGQGGPTTSAPPAAAWCVPRLARARFRSASLPQASTRSGRSQKINGGVHRAWSLPACVQPRRPNQVPHPLVFAEEPEGGEKVRFIADCRQLNQFLTPKTFRLDHLSGIFPYLRKGMWGAKVDLKHAYFHLANSQKLLPYMRINIGEEIYQFTAAVFGLNVLPQLFMSVMKVLQKIWRKKGMLVFVYLDDILVLGTTAQQTQKHLDMVLETLEEAGFMVNQKKSSQVPQRVLEHLGFQIDFQQGHLAVPGGKIKTCRKELGKLVTFSSMTPRKMAAILGTVRSFLTAMPFLRAFTNHMLSFVDLHSSRGWDCQLPIPPILKAEVLRIKDLMISWSGRLFQGHCPVRTLHSDSSSHGWAGVDLTGKKAIQEFWRDQGGLHINIKELTAALHTVKSLAKRNEHVTLVVDNSVAFSYLRKGGGEKTPPQFANARSLGMVHGKTNTFASQTGPLCGMSGRFPVQDPPRQRGLHISPPNIFKCFGKFPGMDTTVLGHVCQSRKLQISPFCEQVPPLAGSKVRCLKLQFGRHFPVLCKSSLDLHKSVAAPFVGESPPHLPNDHPSLGFCTVVAPFGKTESAKKSSFGGKPLSGSFHQQCRPLNASNKMAPDLHFVIRKKLEEQQISSEGIQAYLNQLPSLTRYQSAFEVFWRQCVGQNLDLSTASLWEIASQLLKLNVFQAHQGRNAYGALLLIPGLDQLRFSPLLKQIKRGWNQSVPKYATFWSGSNLLKKLATQALDWTSPSQIRDRLILSWRLVQLCRSIDLARLFRKVTMVDGRPFVWIQRKGWTQPRWEEVLCPPLSTSALGPYCRPMWT